MTVVVRGVDCLSRRDDDPGLKPNSLETKIRYNDALLSSPDGDNEAVVVAALI